MDDSLRGQGSPAAGTCEGVHECGQGAVEHLEEGVSAGILLRAAQHRVLQDVRDPRTVHGSRSELDAERKRGVRRSDEDGGSEDGMLLVHEHHTASDVLRRFHRPEQVIGVISGCVEVLSSSFVMAQLHCCEKQVRDRHHLVEAEPAAE